MRPRFGTDGVRGVANAELTPQFVLDLGRVAARLLGDGGSFLIGRDTRQSGAMFAAAFAAGAASSGAAVIDLGVLPTPCVAYLAGVHGAPAAVISASHNAYADNGVKLFATGGQKLTDEQEAAVEAALDAVPQSNGPVAGPTAADVGTVSSAEHLSQLYAAHLISALEGRDLSGLRVVLDCGHGAASALAGPAFVAAGADVTVLNADPDGTNINAGCGSTDPSGLQEAVRRGHAHLGMAFDGDADRVVAVDADGNLVDGDHIIAVAAIDLKERGALVDDTVVVTVMTNLGFRLAMEHHGITVVETPVGDKHVLRTLLERGWSVGGEQSGHVIFPQHATTGDGMLTGLLLADAVKRAGRPLADLASSAMTRLPQVLKNVKVAERRADIAALLADDIASVEAELGRTGRVLIRPSGTEPVVRVMVEAASEPLAEQAAQRLAAAVERVAGAEPLT
ncbi:MAG: phosphoglucosamine mutase [Acidimicrobiales bacterium]